MNYSISELGWLILLYITDPSFSPRAVHEELVYKIINIFSKYVHYLLPAIIRPYVILVLLPYLR